MRASIAGGGPAILASGQSGPDQVAVDASNVYWMASASVWRVPIGGGTGAVIPTGDQYVSGLVVASPNTFVAFGDSSVGEMPSGGGLLTPVVGPGAVPYGAGIIAVDAANVYGSDGTRIVSTPISGGAPITLASGQHGIARIAVDATSVYWTATNDGTVMKAPLDGSGPPVTLAVLQSYPTGIAVDATSVYWTNHAGAASCAAGAVMKVAIAGGAPITLADNQSTADGIAVDATHVYWTTGGARDSAETSGAVMMLPLR